MRSQRRGAHREHRAGLTLLDMTLSVTIASEADAADIAALRNATAAHLSEIHGIRASCVTEKSVLRGIMTDRVLLARARGKAIATLRLATKKPWAIDLAYFTPVARALYLHDLAVHPDRQRTGVGCALVDLAKTQALAWPAQAIRLDAYDAEHGAGGFYKKCRFSAVGSVVYRATPLIYFELLF